MEIEEKAMGSFAESAVVRGMEIEESMPDS
jgi:hypothetical protein